MEVLREATREMIPMSRFPSFNPCFNGSVERGVRGDDVVEYLRLRFNPCFNGSVERGHLAHLILKPRLLVSILVLMEVLREEQVPRVALYSLLRFNPCFNGSVERGAMSSPRVTSSAGFQSLF